MFKICIVAIDIRSAHNVGSILRTSDGFSAEVILCGITPRPKNLNGEDRLPHVIEKTHSAIAKTALGAEENVAKMYFKSPIEAIKYLRAENYSIFALEQNEDSEPITKLNINNNTAIIVGPEVEGLPSEIVEKCDKIHEIPMLGQKESFNVSVATGIVLYQARQNDLKNMLK